MPIRAVTFDFWNTIAVEPVPGSMRDARHAAVVETLEAHGVEMDAEHLAGHVAEVVRGREQAWAEGVRWRKQRGFQTAEIASVLGKRRSKADPETFEFLVQLRRSNPIRRLG